MAGSLRLQRVLIVGSSVGFYVRPPAADDDDSPFDEHLERLLAERGIDAVVHNECRWFDTIVDAYRRLPELLTRYRPDVIIVVYGYIESQPLVCPRWFATWLFTWTPRSHPVNRALRAAVEPRVRRAFLRLAPKLASRSWLPSRVEPARVRSELGRYIALAAKERRTHVVCANVPATNDRIESVFPTTGARLRATSDAIEAGVRDAGHRATLIDLRGLVADAGADSVMPDGIHLSAHGHRLLAEELARVIARR